jgi:hypothetical protein
MEDKTMNKLIIVIACSINVNLIASSPVFIHHATVQASNGVQVALPNHKPQKIDVTYTPQQIVTVKKNLTPLPLSHHAYTTGMQYFKCITPIEHPQKKADRITVELLVRKEPLGKTMAAVMEKQAHLKSHENVIRLYRKVTSDSQKQSSSWQPILTLPEKSSAQKILEAIKIAPDGNIHVGNC